MGYQTCKESFSDQNDVVAFLPGSESGSVTIGGHYDSRPFEGLAPGAVDNGSGASAVLAIAKAIADAGVSLAQIAASLPDEPSSFLSGKAAWNNNMKVISLQRLPGDDLSIGVKRNIGVHAASGDLIAHFDDDDLYAPGYLAMSHFDGAAALKLSSWYVGNAEVGAFGYCDAARLGRRRWRLRSLALMPDEFGVCLHVQHGDNVSDIDPFVYTDVPLKEIRSLKVELATRLSGLGSSTSPQDGEKGAARIMSRLCGQDDSSSSILQANSLMQRLRRQDSEHKALVMDEIAWRSSATNSPVVNLESLCSN
eukprot:g23054.t1